MNLNNNSTANEIEHFTHLEHIWWGAKSAAGQKRYDNKASEFKKIIKNRGVIKILEVGCGDGEFTKRLLTVVKPNTKVVATDITPAVVTRGKKLIKNTMLTFKVDNLEAMSFPKESFDVICGISILHHVNTKKALREIYRVLKKGGEIFFTEPNYVNPHIFLGLNISFFRKMMEFSPDETAFKRWELEKMVKNAGFKNTSVSNYDFLHPKTPQLLINPIETIGNILEKIPILKEISGSLIVYAKK